MVVNGRRGYAVLLKGSGNEGLLFGRNVLFAALHAVVEALAKVIHQFLFDGRGGRGAHGVLDVRHALSQHVAVFLGSVCRCIHVFSLVV